MKLIRPEIIYSSLKKPVKYYLDKKFNIELGINELNENGAFLMLGHHVTMYDPLISNAYNNRLIRYLTGDANYDNKLKKSLLSLVDSIPFSKNNSDMKAIRMMHRHIKKGNPIGLYPEGGRNWDGKTDNIIPSTAKLIKFLKVPVYITFYKGGYLSSPRWSSHLRRGKVIIDIIKLFDSNECKTLPEEEILNRLVNSLKYNEFEWQKEHMIPFKGKKLAEHIERLLYKCPNCNSYNSFTSSKDNFVCKKCNVTYKINLYGFIENCNYFKDTVSWNDWQRKELQQLVQSDFTFKNKNILLIKGKKRAKKVRNFVDMNINRTHIEIINKKNGKEEIPISKISGISVTFLDLCDFYYKNTRYRLIFNPKKHMSIKLFYDILLLLKGGIDIHE